MELEGIVLKGDIHGIAGDFAPIGQHPDGRGDAAGRATIAEPQGGVPGAVTRCAGDDDLAVATEPAEVGAVALLLRVDAAQVEAVIPRADVDPMCHLELEGDQQRGQREHQQEQHRWGADRTPRRHERLREPVAQRPGEVGEGIAPPDDAATLPWLDSGGRYFHQASDRSWFGKRQRRATRRE